MLPSAKLAISLSPPSLALSATGLIPSLAVIGVGVFVAGKIAGAIAKSISSAEDRGADFLTTRVSPRHDLLESRMRLRHRDA